ncbi:MAG: 3-dehydroquinate synthase [Candidatus Shikimatogenerans bostrichidophilus]|nr:MAG: 3-dehydroquinate synthase [Candidatus Shikimatogenerans bostrichidophilus]
MFKKKIKNIILSNNFNYLQKYIIKKKINNIILLLDKNIKRLFLSYFLKKNKLIKNIKIIVISPGEKEKNLKISIKIWKKFIKYKIDKNSLLINLGGGVITDLGGFVGFLFKRGIRVINIPTTLLGMIDASIGGKNGINFLNYKNEIGIIKEPEIILINTFFLKTLPLNEKYSGYGELIKYSLINSKKLWNIIKKINIEKKKKWDKIIYKAVKIKLKIVKQDPEEYIGIRKILNFGHTIGHAIESFFLKKNKPISHGKAISLGIICESWISKKKGKLSKKEYKDIYKYIKKKYKFKPIKDKYFNNILKYIKNDKKNNNKKIFMVLLKKIGKPIFYKNIKKSLIIKSLKKLNNLFKKNKCKE